jgi:hypothetical protein
MLFMSNCNTAVAGVQQKIILSGVALRNDYRTGRGGGRLRRRAAVSWTPQRFSGYQGRCRIACRRKRLCWAMDQPQPERVDTPETVEERPARLARDGVSHLATKRAANAGDCLQMSLVFAHETQHQVMGARCGIARQPFGRAGLGSGVAGLPGA